MFGFWKILFNTSLVRSSWFLLLNLEINLDLELVDSILKSFFWAFCHHQNFLIHTWIIIMKLASTVDTSIHDHWFVCVLVWLWHCWCVIFTRPFFLIMLHLSLPFLVLYFSLFCLQSNLMLLRELLRVIGLFGCAFNVTNYCECVNKFCYFFYVI